MLIETDNKHLIKTCFNIAQALPEHFNQTGLINMAKALETDKLYTLTEHKLKSFATIQTLNNHLAEITWLATENKSQGKGYGSILLEHIENDLKAQGIKMLKVKTLATEANYEPYEKTLRFYQKLGFIHIESIDPYPGWDAGNPCAILIKIIGE